MKGNRLLTIHLFEHTHHSWQNIREGEERERRARRGEQGEKGEKKKKRRRLVTHPRRRRTTKLQKRTTLRGWTGKKRSIDLFDRFLFLLRSKKEKTSSDVSIILLFSFFFLCFSFSLFFVCSPSFFCCLFVLLCFFRETLVVLWLS